jgi:hypothetical protein
MVARGDDGQVCIRRTIRTEIVEVAFTRQTQFVLNFFDLIEASLAAWASMPDTAWHSPLSGFVMGARHDGLAGNIRQLAAQGIVMKAAFADSDFADLNQV